MSILNKTLLILHPPSSNGCSLHHTNKFCKCHIGFSDCLCNIWSMKKRLLWRMIHYSQVYLFHLLFHLWVELSPKNTQQLQEWCHNQIIPKCMCIYFWSSRNSYYLSFLFIVSWELKLKMEDDVDLTYTSLTTAEIHFNHKFKSKRMNFPPHLISRKDSKNQILIFCFSQPFSALQIQSYVRSRHS